MALNTFNELTSTVIAYTENSDTEFADMLPNIINIAENRITRDLDTYGFVCHFTVSATKNDPYLTKPVGTLYIKNVEHVNASGTRSFLDKKTDEFLKLYWPERTSIAASPEIYAEWDHETVIVAPAPDAGGTFELAAVVQPTHLSSVNVSNWHTNFAMNALFYASMVEAYSFMKAWDQIAPWEQRYQQEIAKMKFEIEATRYDEMDRGEITKPRI